MMRLRNFFAVGLLVSVGILYSVLGTGVVEALGRAAPISRVDHPYGLSYNSFNRFTDSYNLCIWFFQGNATQCDNSSYNDERDFVFLRDTSTNSTVKKYYHDLTDPSLKEGDIVRVAMYAHNNSTQPTRLPDGEKTARDVRLGIALSGSQVQGSIQAKNAYFSDQEFYDDPKDENHSARFEDIGNILLPASTGLEFYMPNGTASSLPVTMIKYVQTSPGNYTTVTEQVPANQFSVTGNTFEYRHGDQEGCYGYSFYLYVDLIVKKKAALCGDSIVQPGEQCDNGAGNGTPGNSCSSSCQLAPLCGDGIKQASEQCDDGVRNGTATSICSAQCTVTACGDGVADVSTGEQCDDGNKINGDGCSNSCQIEERICDGSCACVGVDIQPKFRGDFQESTISVSVSNKNKTAHTGKVVLVNKNQSYQYGYLKKVYPANSRNNTPHNSISETWVNNEGDVEILGIQNVTIQKGYTRRNRPDLDAKYPITWDGTQNYDGSQPINIYNLLPGNPNAASAEGVDGGDQVIFAIKARARTSKSGKELSEQFSFMDYDYYMRTQSNNAYDTMVVAKPFLMTFNAGDIVTSTLITGIANINQLRLAAANSPQYIREISGAVFNFGPRQTVFDADAGATEMNRQFATPLLNPEKFKSALADNMQYVTLPDDRSSGLETRFTNESQLESGLFSTRPDKERIFTLNSGSLVIGDSSQPLHVRGRETIIVKDGDVTILNDIVYDTQTSEIPSLAIVIEKGHLKIHPSVTSIAGVYIISTGTIDGTADWKNYYMANGTPKQLTVEGALLGNINELLKSRPYVSNPDDAGAAVRVNFNGRLLSSPPPGLREILGGDLEKLKQ